MRYRSEIDGLRALAVLPVILFHAKFQTFSGGFVGVDIFFVISGYLITSLIYREIREDSFSIVHFYERRIRRILPALFVVSLACIPFAWIWMIPAEYELFSKSLFAINIFASNIFFWKESGYFAPSVDLKPLLHTWSLAVEEQFYVIFPLFLLLFSRIDQRLLFAIIVALVGVSLGLAELGSRVRPSANFFLLPTRAWELGVGAILAMSANAWSRADGPLAQAGSIVGLGMILYAIFAFDPSVPLPSLWSLVPVGGTALIIAFARPTTVVGKVLSTRPIVGLGLISYSAYLWHLPLFTFARIRIYYDDVSPALYLGLSVVSLILAYLSWRFVEQPCRSKTVFSRAQVFSGAGAVSASIVVFGLAGYFTSGFPGRNDDFDINLAQRLAGNTGLSTKCNREFTLSAECRTDDNPEIIVWGDSYAMHLIDGIIASNEEASVVQMTKNSCGPIPEISPIILTTYNIKWAKGCIDFNELVVDYISTSNSIKFAVLAFDYKPYLAESGIKILLEGKESEPDTNIIEVSLLDTLDWISAQGIKPVVVAPPPGKSDHGYCAARNAWLGREDSTICNSKKTEYNSIDPDVYYLLKIVETRHQVIWPSNYLCEVSDCKSTYEDIFIYMDSEHYSREGSRHIGKAMDFYGLITRGM